MKKQKIRTGVIGIDKNILLYIILGAGLVICAITDLKNKVIYLPVIISELLLISGFHIWHKSFSLMSFAGAAIVCVLFIAAGFASGGQIGIGDALLFAVTGSGLGIMVNMFIIMLSFILAFCAAVFLVFVKHKSRNFCIPLAPFVLSAFAIYIAGIYCPL